MQNNSPILCIIYRYSTLATFLYSFVGNPKRSEKEERDICQLSCVNRVMMGDGQAYKSLCVL